VIALHNHIVSDAITPQAGFHVAADVHSIEATTIENTPPLT
jgi:hypothetical protein